MSRNHSGAMCEAKGSWTSQEEIKVESEYEEDDSDYLPDREPASFILEQEGRDRDRYKIDRIITHHGRGSHIKYLVQYKGTYVRGDQRRTWMRSDQVQSALLNNYRIRLKRECQRRRDAKRLIKLRIKPTLVDSSTQVNMISSVKMLKYTQHSTSLLAPRKSVHHDMSTQTELTYFIFDVVKLQDKQQQQQ